MNVINKTKFNINISDIEMLDNGLYSGLTIIIESCKIEKNIKSDRFILWLKINGLSNILNTHCFWLNDENIPKLTINTIKENIKNFPIVQI